MESTSDLLITGPELAKELGIALSTVYRLDSSGRIPSPVKIGRSVRWRKAELAAWVDAGCPPRREWNERQRAKAQRN